MSRYIVGTPGVHLVVKDRQFRTTMGDREHLKFRGGESGFDHYVFRIVRGQAEEFRTRDDNAWIAARTIPTDAEPALEEIDARIEKLAAEMETLRHEKQEFLNALVPRCGLVKVEKNP